MTGLKTGSLGLMTVGLLTAILSPAVWANPPAPVMAAEPENGKLLQPSPIPDGSELEPTALTVDDWMAQAVAAEPAMITNVQVNSTPAGLAIILVSDQPLSAGASRVEGNALITEIPDAALNLTDQAAAEQFSPAEGIALVQVSSLPDGGVQVAVTGTDAPPEAQISSEAGNLILSIVPGVAQAGAADEAIQIAVTGEQDGGYDPSTATTGTRIEAPLEDLPLSIQVIPREVIEDRQVVRLQELADNVPGVEHYSSYGGLSSNDYYIRGFHAGESFRNGFRDFTFISPRDTANVERVEFLRGPASVLYGGGFNFSGAVNTITKRPLADSQYELSGTVGNYDFYRPTLDFTGPLTDDASLLYRLNVAYENADSFRDFVENESVFIAPVLTWQIDPETTLTAEFEYQNYDYVFDRGFFPSDIVFDLPISRFLWEPDINRAEFDSYYFGYDFEHRFNDQWRIRQGFGGLISDGGINSVSLDNFSAPFVEPDGRTLTRQVNQTDELQENYSLQTELVGEFNTGLVEHNLLFGVEYARYKFAYDFLRAPIDPIDIFDPVYGARPGEFLPNFAEEYGTRNVGVYLQDLIYLTPELITLVGGRFDWGDSFYRDRFTGETLSDTSDTNFSPRLGLVYKPIEETSLYASWANSYIPTTFGGRSRTGEAFEPERGEQFEVGIKQSFLNDRLSANLAFYHLERENVSTTDPVDPDFSIQTGEQTSRGIELDLAGEISPGWNMIATYAHTDAFVSEDEDLPIGDRLSGIPRNTASLWSTYEIQSGNLQGLGFGLGLIWVGEREAELPNTDVELPAYFRTDASLFYRRDNYEAAISVKNLFDEEYYNTQGFYITPAAPLTVLGTIRVNF